MFKCLSCCLFGCPFSCHVFFLLECVPNFLIVPFCDIYWVEWEKKKKICKFTKLNHIRIFVINFFFAPHFLRNILCLLINLIFRQSMSAGWWVDWAWDWSAENDVYVFFFLIISQIFVKQPTHWMVQATNAQAELLNFTYLREISFLHQFRRMSGVLACNDSRHNRRWLTSHR